MTHMAETTTDQRLVKGARSRAAIARHAADVASVEGLTGVSIGRLAADLGVSKSGIATLFGSKEALQLAAVRAAREVFVERIIAPAMAEPSGPGRLRVLIDRWFDHVLEPSFPGGCFRTAAVAEFDSRPGPVRDAIAADRDEWLTFLAGEIGKAQAAGALTGHDPDALAFELDVLVGAASTAHQFGDEKRVRMARQLVDRLLA
ncbi:TetR/AcrR family transcriptional regulator [Nocardia puris]|nr:TetR/AcrR family transcriptional regulator [Nocardia puris]MBF6367120.1 TetR/AcrR family transcriptional regulator [Nocardia puris]MBF6461903.1 TetR/AcrR family transcriptional regulator [Nocardia puris]